MFFFKGQAGEGKTLLAMLMANKMDCYFCVKSIREANRVFSLNRDNKIFPKLKRFPVTYEEVLGGSVSLDRNRGIIIDNVQDYIAYSARGLHVSAATMNHVVLDEEGCLKFAQFKEDSFKMFEDAIKKAGNAVVAADIMKNRLVKLIDNSFGDYFEDFHNGKIKHRIEGNRITFFN